MPAPGPSMSTHRHNPASSFRPPRNVTWNGHRYHAMPNRVRIDPIKVNVINYQSVRRGRHVKLRGSRGSQSSRHGQQRTSDRQPGESRPRERPVRAEQVAEQANGNAAEGTPCSKTITTRACENPMKHFDG